LAQHQPQRHGDEAAARCVLDCGGGIVFVNSNAAIEAALAGRGVALVRRSLVEPELASRRLLAVKVPPLRTPPLAYHLVYRAETLATPAMRTFFEWILAQAGQAIKP